MRLASKLISWTRNLIPELAKRGLAGSLAFVIAHGAAAQVVWDILRLRWRKVCLQAYRPTSHYRRRRHATGASPPARAGSQAGQPRSAGIGVN